MSCPVVQWLSLHVLLWWPGVCWFESPGQTCALLGMPCCGRRPTYKVEEDGHGYELRASLPQQTGGLVVDVSSGLIFLKK